MVRDALDRSREEVWLAWLRSARAVPSGRLGRLSMRS